MRPDSDFSRLPDWSGWPCVLVASGPSAEDARIEDVRGRAKVVVVNTSVKLAPWADALYACDVAWWRVNRRLWRDFAGIKASVVASVRGVVPDAIIFRDGGQSGLSDEVGTLRHGRNSGFQALGMAMMFGARRIVLVGYDMRGQHWHGRHPRGLRNPTESGMVRWARLMDDAAPAAAAMGAEIVVASPGSALTAYPKMEWKEAVDWLMN